MLRVAVIGAGAWGLNHVRVVATERDCVLVGVADPDPLVVERVHAIAPGVRTLRDPDPLFADASIDAVVIATPAATHAELAQAALAAGKHVLIEKPLAMNLDDAKAIASTPRAPGQIAMVGHLMVYHPAVVRLRELLRSGAL